MVTRFAILSPEWLYIGAIALTLAASCAFSPAPA